MFYGSKGYLAIDGYTKYKTWIGKEAEPGPGRSEGGDHFANFITAVRSRKRGELNAEIEEGAISTTLVHLANISYRLGRTVHFDAGRPTLPRRHGGQRDVPPRIPQAVRGAAVRLISRLRCSIWGSSAA